MRSAFALRINSGKNIFIVVTLENLRIFQSYFSRKGRKDIATAAPGYGFSREKGIQKCPQAFLNPEYKIVFPLKMARAQRKPFQIVFLQLTHKAPEGVTPGGFAML